MKYGYTKQVPLSFQDAKEKTVAELAKEGFGILTEIDVKAALKKKLGIDYDEYVILGACNPPFAHRALLSEKEIGLFLPCNVIVYEKDGSTFVSAILPTAAMGMLDNPALSNIAVEVETKLKKAVDSVL
ncbi:MAG: DUF302 domain-containing protein [Candidatus Yonathbacteria bacterium]|nr:DUF302 domain-containing protein [Candidatus Yonathbacteria bacterium]